MLTTLSLQEKRAHLANLMDLQKLIQQLQVVREVPAALRMLVASRDFGSAVLLYSNMQPLLQAHGHIGFLRPMAREAHDIMKVPHIACAAPVLPCSAQHALAPAY